MKVYAFIMSGIVSSLTLSKRNPCDFAGKCALHYEMAQKGPIEFLLKKWTTSERKHQIEIFNDSELEPFEYLFWHLMCFD